MQKPLSFGIQPRFEQWSELNISIASEDNHGGLLIQKLRSASVGVWLFEVFQKTISFEFPALTFPLLSPCSASTRSMFLWML